MAGAPLSCYELRENQLSLLVLDGTLDVTTSDQALAAIRDYVLKRGSTVVLDGSRLDFIDSKGVGTLINALKGVREMGGRLYLREPSVPARKILELCGLMSLFPEPPAELRDAKAPQPEPAANGAPGSAGRGTRSGAAAAAPGPRMRRAA